MFLETCINITIKWKQNNNVLFPSCRDIARGKEKQHIPVTNDVDDTNYPQDFTYVTESVWTSQLCINNMINSLAVS